MQAEVRQIHQGCKPMTDLPEFYVQAGSKEDDLPQQAAHAPNRKRWSQEEVATLKRGIQIWGHQWGRIQVGLLLGLDRVRCMAVRGWACCWT